MNPTPDEANRAKIHVKTATWMASKLVCYNRVNIQHVHKISQFLIMNTEGLVFTLSTANPSVHREGFDDPLLAEILMMRMSILHQNSGGIVKSIPSPLTVSLRRQGPPSHISRELRTGVKNTEPRIFLALFGRKWGFFKIMLQKALNMLQKLKSRQNSENQVPTNGLLLSGVLPKWDKWPLVPPKYGTASLKGVSLSLSGIFFTIKIQ